MDFNRLFFVKVYIGYSINQTFMELNNIIYIIVAIVIAWIIFSLFMWLWPLIVILLLAFFIYMALTGSDRY